MTTFLLHALAFSLVFFLLSLLGRRLFVTPLRRRIAELELEVEKVRSFSHMWWDCAVDNLNEVDRLKKNLNETAKAHDELVGKYARLKMENAHLVFCHKTACDRLGLLQRVVERLHADNHNLKAELLAKTRKKGQRRTAAECLTH